jgi:hypothetical protein
VVAAAVGEPAEPVPAVRPPVHAAKVVATTTPINP